MPWLGEHTDDVLTRELGLDAEVWPACAADGTIS